MAEGDVVLEHEPPAPGPASGPGLGPRPATGDVAALLRRRQGTERVLPGLVRLAGVMQVTRDNRALGRARWQTRSENAQQGVRLSPDLSAVLVERPPPALVLDACGVPVASVLRLGHDLRKL